ncbi:Major facilitator superfamily MFS-1, partial [mine drainage metagenome]
MIIDPISGIYTDKDIFWPHSTKGYFITIGLVFAGISVIMIPFSQNVMEFVILILIFYAASHFIRPPYNALMPEVIRRKNWGEASGYINTFLALGSITAFLVIGPLIKVSLYYAAMLAGILIISVGLITPWKIVESPIREKTEHKKGAITTLLKRKEMSIFFLMQLFWWASYESIATYFYFLAKDFNLSLTPGGSAIIYVTIAFAIFNVTTVISSIPIGILFGKTLRKKNLITIGLIIMILMELIGSFYHTSSMFLLIVLAIAGIGWAFILTASYPLGAYLVKKFTGNKTPLGLFFGLNSVFTNGSIMIGAIGTAAIMLIFHISLIVVFPLSFIFSLIA